ncbi:alpha/beta fold hydrolase [Phycicoccus avicenniae]|uniref:alpha/beta fold hydrolase n=1 Tax=Phycicoccus avicenniae TaxID=2828860 RepID=UPI003D2A447F
MEHPVLESVRINTRVGQLAVWHRPGAGTPLLLWPSLFTDHTLYEPLVAALDASWSPVLVDGPGFGASDPPLPRVQPDQYAAAAREVLDALELGRAGWLGTSWGGQIGAYLAADHADRIAWALLANTPVEPARGASWVPLLARLLGPTRFYGGRVAASMLSSSSRARPEVLEQMVGRFVGFARRPMGRTAATTLQHFPGVVDELLRARVPVTVLMGAQDRLYPPESTQAALADRPARVLLVEVPGCGHLLPLEAPQAVADELERLRERAAE